MSFVLVRFLCLDCCYATSIRRKKTFVNMFFVILRHFVDSATFLMYYKHSERQVIIMNERLKKLRRELNLTQQEFSEKLGIKRNTIATYESGRNEPIDAVVALICKEFNVSEEWLRTGKGEMFVERTADEEIASFIGRIQMNDTNNFKKRFISALSKLDESEWAVLEKLALEMSEKKD